MAQPTRRNRQGRPLGGHAWVAVAASLLGLFQCARAPQPRPAPTGGFGPAAQASQPGQRAGFKGAKDHCFGGAPAEAASHARNVKYLRHRAFTVGYATAAHQPLWVCEHLFAHQLGRSPRRRPPFRPDPLLGAREQATLKAFRRSGYDRGHLAPAADFALSPAARRESFFLTNVAPQVGVGFNRHAWKEVEQKARQLTRRWGESYVITGTIAPGSLAGDWGPAPPSTLRDGRTVIPEYFYKLIVDPRGPRAVAVLLENQKHERGAISRGASSVDAIERLSGLDFFPQLPASAQAAFEAQVLNLVELSQEMGPVGG